VGISYAHGIWLRCPCRGAEPQCHQKVNSDLGLSKVTLAFLPPHAVGFTNPLVSQIQASGAAFIPDVAPVTMSGRKPNLGTDASGSSPMNPRDHDERSPLPPIYIRSSKVWRTTVRLNLASTVEHGPYRPVSSAKLLLPHWKHLGRRPNRHARTRGTGQPFAVGLRGPS
jgi:hypothetical protein